MFCTTAAGTGNVISGNNSNGVLIDGASADNNSVMANYIGLQADGVSALGNGSHGVRIDSATNSDIGYLNPGYGNRIAHNGGDGVFIASGSDNSVLTNRIFSNTGLGIDLGTNGVTLNDPDDVDTGANELQNFPVITGVVSNGAEITIHGVMNSVPDTEFFAEFFFSSSCDPTGHGEGEFVVGSGTSIGSGVTNAEGDFSFSATFTVGVPISSFITATAQPDGAPHHSSEFSLCHQLTGDADSDGDLDGADNCPLWPNPAQNLPPWSVPAGDSDCDGFTDAAEAAMATDPADVCPDNATDDAWPPDINMSGGISVTDVLFLKPWFGQNVPPAPTRLDMVPSGSINVTDAVEFKKYFNLSCT
jgi:hypothetical protein